MDHNAYALEIVVAERLTHARAEAERLADVARVRARAPVIRSAAAPDSAAVAAIWNREIRQTAATTDTEARTVEALRAWLAARGPAHPVIVAVEGDEVVAFGALSPYRAKPSYAHTVENSVYVKDGWRGQGLGGLVLEHLVALARAHGHRSVIARVTAVNAASLTLHERHGFARVGLERQVACKHGVWLDVVTLQRVLMT
jgi:phosphinothricin acetyltransferase